MYADVAVCLPLARTFVYRLNQHVEPGCRVEVAYREDRGRVAEPDLSRGGGRQPKPGFASTYQP